MNIFDLEPVELERLKADLTPALTIDNFLLLLNAVSFYADPETYFGVATMCDRPCGGFGDDFSSVELLDDGIVIGEDQHPGKHARETLRTLFAAHLSETDK